VDDHIRTWVINKPLLQGPSWKQLIREQNHALTLNYKQATHLIKNAKEKQHRDVRKQRKVTLEGQFCLYL